MTCEEVLAEVLRENDEEYSSFNNAKLDKGEEDYNSIYGYPNDLLVSYAFDMLWCLTFGNKAVSDFQVVDVGGIISLGNVLESLSFQIEPRLLKVTVI